MKKGASITITEVSNGGFIITGVAANDNTESTHVLAAISTLGHECWDKNTLCGFIKAHFEQVDQQQKRAKRQQADLDAANDELQKIHGDEEPTGPQNAGVAGAIGLCLGNNGVL